MKTVASCFAVASMIGFAAAARGADISVGPGQSIQSAILLAQSGDRVLVSPGTYFEVIDFGAKKIEIIGIGGASLTTIDGGGSTSPVVKSLGFGASLERVLDGFTIRNGANGVVTGPSAGITIARCVLRDAVKTVSGTGYGLVAADGSVTPIVTRVVESVIEHNPAGGTLGDVALLRTTVAHNQGRGVEGKILELIECAILDNTAPTGAGVYAVTFTEALNVKLTGTTIAGNTATDVGGTSGLVVSTQSLFGGASIASCRVVGNHSSCGAAVTLFKMDHSGLFGASTTCYNTIIAGNTSSTPSCGAGIEIGCSGFSTPFATLDRCTVVGNDGVGFRVITANTIPVVRRSIIWNQPNALPANTQVSESDVEFGYPGTGNFNLDPAFANLATLDLHLTPASPCIDLFSGTSGADFEGEASAGNFDCGADEFRPRLYYTGSPVAGGPLGFGIVGAQNAAPVLYFASLERLDPGIPTSFGSFGLGLPVVVGFPLDFGALSPVGTLAFSIVVPVGVPSGIAVHTQAFIGGPSATLTNVATLVFE